MGTLEGRKAVVSDAIGPTDSFKIGQPAPLG